MSSIKLSPNASGTGEFTIAAPNSNTNRTLTLPDQTGTVLTNAGPFTANASTPNGAVTADASGNVGIGVTPSAWGTSGATKALQVSTLTSVYQAFGGSNFASNTFFNGSADTYITSAAAGKFAFDSTTGVFTWANAPSGTAGNAATFTERARIDSGRLLVGRTSNTDSATLQLSNEAGGANIAMLAVANTTADSYPCMFRNPNGQVGAIKTNGTSTAYNTSSDYRLKEDVQPMQDALSKVAALKPVTYKWKSDGSDGQGFIAHELQAVVPDCVTGEKDAVDAEGNPVYQGIDTSFLVATLTAAIQELNAKVAALEARLASDGPSNGGQA